MVEIVDEKGNINYEQALNDLKVFLYGQKGKIDPNIHFKDIRFYLKPRNLLFILRSFSFSIIFKVLNLWRDLGYKTLHRYFQLNLIAVVNKLKEQAKIKKGKRE